MEQEAEQCWWDQALFDEFRAMIRGRRKEAKTAGQARKVT
jgi:hypothetical protein